MIDANIMPPLISSFDNADFDVEIKKEAAMAIVNAMGCGSPEQIRYMVRNGCFKPLSELLTSPDSSVRLLFIYYLFFLSFFVTFIKKRLLLQL